MSLFSKKAKVKAPATIQEAQQQFNQLMFNLGNAVYRKHMVKEGLSIQESEINSLIQKADGLGKSAASLQAKAKQELAETIAEGQQDSNDESTEVTAEGK